MKSALYKAFILAPLLATPTTAHALSCAWPSVDEAKSQYPVTVMGKVIATEHEAIAEDEQHMLLRGYQHVTLAVEELRQPKMPDTLPETLKFRESITMYDRSFFREDKSYVVFLEQEADGTLVYPVCGFHLRADDPMLDISTVKADIGWD